jgi:hypothetical protein
MPGVSRFQSAGEGILIGEHLRIELASSYLFTSSAMSSAPISAGPKTTYAAKDPVKRMRITNYAALKFLGWVERISGQRRP